MVKKVKEVLLETISSFGGEYPDVPLSEGIEYEALIKGDTDPYFLTLPVGKINTVSRNDRVYRREAVETIRDAINTERVGGILGHLRDEQRAYEFHIPVIHWVGAIIEGELLWAKGYIPRTQPKLREYMRISMRTHARVGTSIYGTAEIADDGRVLNLWIESIDIAHPDRVGVEAAALIPLVTGETVKDEAMEALNAAVQEGYEFRARIRRAIWVKVTDRPDYDEIIARIADLCGFTMGQLYDLMNSADPIPDDKLQVFSTVLNIPLDELRQLSAINPDPGSGSTEETTNEETEVSSTSNGETNMATVPNPAPVPTPETVAGQGETPLAEVKRQHQEALREMQIRLDEKTAEVRDFEQIKKLLEARPGDDPIMKVRALTVENGDLRRENAELLESTIVLAVADKVKVENQRGVIEQAIRDLKPARKIDVTMGLDTVLARPEIKTLLMHGVSETMGSTQTRPNAPASEADMTGRIVIPGMV